MPHVEHRLDQPGDPAEVPVAALGVVVAHLEERPRLRVDATDPRSREQAEQKCGEAPEAGADDDDRPTHGVPLPQPVEPGVGDGAQVLWRAGVPGVAHHGVGERDPVRRELPAGDEGRAVGGDPGELVVLGDRRAPAAAAPARRPARSTGLQTVTGTASAVSPAKRHDLQPSRDGGRGQPPRRGVAGHLHHRPVAERGAHVHRVGGVEHHLDLVTARHGEAVLDALQRRSRQVEHPPGTVATELPGPREHAVALEDDGRDLRVGRVEAEPDVVVEELGGHRVRTGRSSGRCGPCARARRGCRRPRRARAGGCGRGRAPHPRCCARGRATG